MQICDRKSSGVRSRLSRLAHRPTPNARPNGSLPHLCKGVREGVRSMDRRNRRRAGEGGVTSCKVSKLSHHTTALQSPHPLAYHNRRLCNPTGTHWPTYSPNQAQSRASMAQFQVFQAPDPHEPARFNWATEVDEVFDLSPVNRNTAPMPINLITPPQPVRAPSEPTVTPSNGDVVPCAFTPALVEPLPPHVVSNRSLNHHHPLVKLTPPPL